MLISAKYSKYTYQFSTVREAFCFLKEKKNEIGNNTFSVRAIYIQYLKVFFSVSEAWKTYFSPICTRVYPKVNGGTS